MYTLEMWIRETLSFLHIWTPSHGTVKIGIIFKYLISLLSYLKFIKYYYLLKTNY